MSESWSGTCSGCPAQLVARRQSLEAHLPVRATCERTGEAARRLLSADPLSRASGTARSVRFPRKRGRGGSTDAEADMPSAEASGAICVQRFDDSRNSAIHTTYRISLRSSSLREPRYPLLRVVWVGMAFAVESSQPQGFSLWMWFWCEWGEVSSSEPKPAPQDLAPAFTDQRGRPVAGPGTSARRGRHERTRRRGNITTRSAV